MRQSTLSKTVTYLLLILGALSILLPLYMTIIIPFKTMAENTASYFALPTRFNLDNFKTVLKGGRYFRALANTAYITTFVLVGNAIIMPMMSYPIARSMEHSRFYRRVYYFVLLSIFIPFQVKMMPLVKLLSSLRMMHPTGLSILYMASSIGESVFLYVGYMQSIPEELEAAAYIDGANTFQVYTRIVVPLVRPMMATALIRNGLWIWNDFLLPLIILNRSWTHWTLTLFQHNFRTEYSIDYSLTFAALVMSIVPIMLFYVFAQKHIVSGLTSGALKG